MYILKGGFALLSASVLFTGCWFNSPQEITMTETEILYVKAEKVYQEESTINENIALLQEIINTSIDTESVFFAKAQKMTPAAYYGPSFSISDEDYELNKFVGKPLLFSGNGIKGILPIIFHDLGTKEEIDFAVYRMGHESLEKMFDRTYRMLKDEQPAYVNVRLKDMIREGYIEEDDFSATSINKESDLLVSAVFAPYFTKENNEELLKEWFYIVDGHKVNLKKSDYKPYAFVTSIMKASLSVEIEKIRDEDKKEQIEKQEEENVNEYNI